MVMKILMHPESFRLQLQKEGNLSNAHCRNLRKENHARSIVWTLGCPEDKDIAEVVDVVYGN